MEENLKQNDILISNIKKIYKKNKIIIKITFYNQSNKFIKSFKLTSLNYSKEINYICFEPNTTITIKFILENDLTKDELVISNITEYKETTKSNTKDLTKGNYKKLIIAFAMPIFLSSLFQQLYNSADAFIVGKYIGKEALAAVASSGSLIHMLTSFFIGTAMGAGVLISKFFGSSNYIKMRRAIHTDIAVGIISSIILTIIGVSFTPLILRLMKTDPDVLPNSIAYFRYYFLGISANIMYNIFNGILNAVGNSKRPLYYLIFSSCLNILLDYLFIGVFKMGVASAAIATTISQFTSAILCFIHLLNKKNIYHINIKKIKIHKDMIKKILSYGLPTGVQNSVIGLANVIVQSNINAFGKNAMAACGAFNKIEGFAFLPITSFTMAISTFISQNLGAKEFDRAKSGARFGIISSILIAEVIGITIFIFAPNLISIFNKEEVVVALGVKQCRTESLFFFLLAFSHCIASVARGSGKAFIPMIVMLLVWCLLRVVYITVVMHFIKDIQYVFMAYPITWTISSVIYLIYYLRSDWVHNFVKEKGADVL